MHFGIPVCMLFICCMCVCTGVCVFTDIYVRTWILSSLSVAFNVLIMLVTYCSDWSDAEDSRPHISMTMMIMMMMMIVFYLLTALKSDCDGIFLHCTVWKADINVKHCNERLLNKGLIFRSLNLVFCWVFCCLLHVVVIRNIFSPGVS